MEDDNGNMRVIPAEWLRAGGADGNPLGENELGVENMENDLPCADVTAYEAEDERTEDDEL